MSGTPPQLTRDSFRLLPPPPFNPTIRISQSMIWYQDWLYVGGGRGPLKTESRGKQAPADDNALGAEICRYSPTENRWERVYSSPVVGDGEPVARDRSVRAHAITTDKQGVETLYFGIGSLQDQVIIVATEDGSTFRECGEAGLNQPDSDIASIRRLCVVGNKVFTSPVGKNKGRGMADDNVADVVAVFESDTSLTKPWKMVSEPNFGDEHNESINDLIEFNGQLYAATLNRRGGFQVWKSSSKRTSQARWKKVIDNGAYRYAANPVPTCMQVFNGALYIGTGVQRQGKWGNDKYGPIAPELIRVNDDDSWDLICGESRCTPDGLKTPLSGKGAGFDHLFTQAFWTMTEHHGLLYIGTSDWRFWPSYLPRGARHQREDLSQQRVQYLRQETKKFSGHYALYCSADGVNWDTVTQTGLGNNPDNYAIRGLLSTPAGLMVVPASSGKTSAGIELWCAD
ncbi:hypothetical protein E4634_00615 [Mangrovimicrobium sediminis]|uniref:Exo-alpha-sialidase n=1 Tax=Mangrovimicrobium sediminis TaxID=2562682 RepID=A0A4Z0M9M8_9GAMM|nr:hypothetical protein [Haliea sp. SAOS-164]TGD76087.1 hypothetical protein E4634_00615 [Haliea sp. SAOS-164]